MQENNNVYFLYNNVALLYNNAPKQDQDRKKRTFLRKNQGYHPLLEFIQNNRNVSIYYLRKHVFIIPLNLHHDIYRFCTAQ